MMHPWLARQIYFGIQQLRREPVSRAMQDVRATEFISVDQLRKLQAERQIHQLRFAVEHVPYYKSAFAPFRADILVARQWDEVNALMDQLPILEKLEVVRNKEQLRADMADVTPTYPAKTSGSSGTPLAFPCDQTAWAYHHALNFRAMQAFGVGVGEPYAYFFGLHWSKRSQLSIAVRDFVLNRVRVSAYDISRRSVDRHLQRIMSVGPTHFIGYPSAIYDFCVLLHERGLDQLKQLNLKAVFLTSEPLRDYQRTLIGEVTGSRCVNIYGSAEGGITAFECPAGSLHVTAETTWLQVRESGALAGDAILTNMMLRAFPLIRYQIGDEITFSQDTCPCGRPHPLLSAVEGRSGDAIILPNGRRINPNLPSYIFKPLAKSAVVRRYRFVQKRTGDLYLLLAVTPRFNEEHLEIIRRETRSAIGDDIPLTVQIVEELPTLANAKHRDYIVEQ